MAHCCNEDDAHIARLRERQAHMLWLVLGLNAALFVIEFSAGWLAGSSALLADSLDMLGDSLVYGLSLFVVARSARWKAVSAGFKGSLMLLFGVIVLAEAAFKAISGQPPQPAVMAGVGLLALSANLLCLLLLTRHRDDDVNMRSSWVCSRNDLLANGGVLLAAMLVAATGRVWPDVVIGLLIAGVFVHSAIGVLQDARSSLHPAAPH
ncbi:cation diffusion facilitator family transporter [Salinisphaera sp. T31B1]|uniref:cation diffusion facilitator family transporter n=1 Tax=Salinisphaera sp. T31B1 TaxID=727963 RepID=UPI0033407D20